MKQTNGATSFMREYDVVVHDYFTGKMFDG